MHSSSFNSEPSAVKSETEVLLAVTTLVTEGRIPEKLGPKSKGFREGPHCFSNSQSVEHVCDLTDGLCMNYEFVKEELLKLWTKKIPLCIEVILTCGCQEGDYFIGSETVENYIILESWNFNITAKRGSIPPSFQLPQLVNAIRSQLYFSQITAWLTTLEETSKGRLTSKHLRYRIALPGETFKTPKFITNSLEHNFPSTDIGCNRILNVSFLSMPRMSTFPLVQCPSCKPSQDVLNEVNKNSRENECIDDMMELMVDDRMHVLCTLKGKHHCEDFEELENADNSESLAKFKRFRQNLREEQPSTSTLNHLNSTRHNQMKNDVIDTNPSISSIQQRIDVDENCHFHNDLNCKDDDKSRILLEAIERVGLRSPEKLQKKSPDKQPKSRCKSRDLQMDFQDNFSNKRTEMDVQCGNDLVEKKYIYSRLGCASRKCGCDNIYCDRSKSDKCSNRKFSVYVDKKYCDSPIPIIRHLKMKDVSNELTPSGDKNKKLNRKLTFDEHDGILETNSNNDKTKGQNCRGEVIPTAVEQAKFRKSLDNAASMVFHSRTGLPLTSSPAPVRKGKTCFDFDSSITSVSAIKSALFSSSFSTDDDSESDGSLVSPCSPDTFLENRQKIEEEEPKSPVRQRRRKGHASSLLGSFEESVLNGRLEPVSTVHGFTAELGASGAFVPKHLVVPVTVFFYTLGDNDKVSSPYLCHINIGKKGYCVPKIGTVQVTLFNPLGTVVKMFVIMYDLSDMPPNSQTFIRQRTLYLPNDCREKNLEWTTKWLKYLIHIRFVSSKSGKIYLHSDIRMIIFHKSDLDTAAALGVDPCYELRSFTLMPTNPRFSPRK